MIVVTGAAGFIGSCLVNKLNNKAYTDLVLFDDFNRPEKQANYIHKAYKQTLPREKLAIWLEEHHAVVKFVYHIGARTDTTEFNKAVFDELNLNYSKKVWDLCSKHRIPLLYASSAATYGDGKLGYKDDHEIIYDLIPLNPYGESKNDFDKWALKQDHKPPFWAGMKFFNVYGPNEYHKGRMASVILHSFQQIKNTGKVKLFRSHRPDFKDGEQLRDFIYVKDVVDVLFFMMKRQPESGLYNLGTGKARSFLDLAKSTFRALNIPENIEFIDTPEDIRDKYQYFTEANMDKLKGTDFILDFYSLEEGIEEYVTNYLMDGVRY